MTPHPLALELQNDLIDHKESTDENNVYADTNANSINIESNNK